MTSTPAKDIPGASTHPVDVFARYGPKRYAGKVAAAWAVYQVGAPLARKARTRWFPGTTYSIVVPGTDGIYADVHEWVLAQLASEDRRALVAVTGPARSGEDATPDSVGEPPRRESVRFRYDGHIAQKVTIDGHHVDVVLDKDEMSKSGGLDQRMPENYRLMFERVIFYARSQAARDAVTAKLADILARRAQRPPVLRTPTRWAGGWQDRHDLPPRTLDSIVLKAGQMERLVDDLDRFLAAEGEYNRRYHPWHRGYLFHGAPGTGKSSVARALAHRFKMSLYYLPLGQMESDSDLTNLIGMVGPRSMLLIEDVDVFHAATSRDDDAKVTLSGMLNALDGIWTPHGLITVLTTNDKAASDPALIRPGRVDVDEEFTVSDAGQVGRLMDWFYADTFKLPPVTLSSIAGAGMSPADLVGVFTRHDDPQDAIIELLAAAGPLNLT